MRRRVPEKPAPADLPDELFGPARIAEWMVPEDHDLSAEMLRFRIWRRRIAAWEQWCYSVGLEPTAPSVWPTRPTNQWSKQ